MKLVGVILFTLYLFAAVSFVMVPVLVSQPSIFAAIAVLFLFTFVTTMVGSILNTRFN